MVVGGVWGSKRFKGLEMAGAAGVAERYIVFHKLKWNHPVLLGGGK